MPKKTQGAPLNSLKISRKKSQNAEKNKGFFGIFQHQFYRRTSKKIERGPFG